MTMTEPTEAKTFSAGDRVRLTKTRGYWSIPVGSNSSTPRFGLTTAPSVGTEGTVVHMSDLRDNVVVTFGGDPTHMLVSADCLERIEAAPFKVGDRVRLTQPRSYWTADGPATSPNPVEGSVATVQTVADSRGNVVVRFDGHNATLSLVRPDCLTKVENETFNAGDTVKVVMPRRWYDTRDDIVTDGESDHAYVGLIGTVVAESILTQHGNVAVKFDDDRMLVGFLPSCLAKVQQAVVPENLLDAAPTRPLGVVRSHLLGEDGSTVLGLDEAKQGVYQSPTAGQHDFPTPLPTQFVSVEHNTAELDALREQVIALRQQGSLAEELRQQAVTALNEERRHREAERQNSQQSLDLFKEKVARVARRYAEEHDWCSVVDNALAEVGIEPEKSRARFTLNIEVTLDGELTNPEMRENVNSQWINDSFRHSYLTDAIAQAMDADWTNVQVDGISSDVSWDEEWV